MSLQDRFVGKWAIYDTNAGAQFSFGSVFGATSLLILYDDGSGSKLCFCQMGPAPNSPPVAGLLYAVPGDLPYGAIQTLEGALEAAMNNPNYQGPSDNMPSPVDDGNMQLAFFGWASFTDVMSVENRDSGVRFTYDDTKNPPVYTGQTVLQEFSPPVLFCGIFNAVPDPGQVRAFGWSAALDDPNPEPYTVQVIVPSAQFMRQFLQNTAPVSSDYSFVNLSGEDYSGLSLKQATFDNSDLSGTSFQGSDLTGATFKGANLAGANFSGATLSGVHFTVAISVVGCNFSGAILTNASFRGVDLTGVDFTGAHMHGTTFSNTDLTKATFSKPADFSPGQATPNDFSYSTLDVAILGLDWSYFNLTMATLDNLGPKLAPLVAHSTILLGVSLVYPPNGLNLYDDGTGADFSSADLRQCNLSKGNLEKANFTGAQLQGDAIYDAASLAEANLENANFTNANLTGTDLSRAFLWGDQATLTGATLIRTTFTNAYLVALDFSDIAQNQCQGSNFDQSCLINAKFNGTNAGTFSGQPTSFVKACLHGADFSDAKLDGANLASAGVAQSSGTFPVTLPSVPVPIHITYARGTLGIEAATDGKSICPNQQDGPCTVAQQSASDAPTQWPVQSAVNRLSPGALGGCSEGTSQSARAPHRAEESAMAWFGPRLIEFLRRCFRWRG